MRRVLVEAVGLAGSLVRRSIRVEDVIPSRAARRRCRFWVLRHEQRIGLVLWIVVATMGIAALVGGHYVDDSDWRNGRTSLSDGDP